MNAKKVIKSSEYLDKIGAFSIADSYDEKLIKKAQIKWEADPDLPDTEEDWWEKTQSFGRYFVGLGKRGLKPKDKMVSDSIPYLNSFIISDFSDDPKNNDFKSALFGAKKAAQDAFGASLINSVRPNWRFEGQLKGKDVFEIYASFRNWAQYQRQILGGDGRASSFLRALKNAENILAKKVDPSFKAKPIIAPTGTTAPTSRGVSKPGGKIPSGRGGAGKPSGGRGRATVTVKPSKFDVNDKLYAIVYGVVKSNRPDLSLDDMSAVYQAINVDADTKKAILDKINTSSYSAENKAKLKDRFLKKVSGEYVPTPGPTPPGPEPTPGPEPVRPSPFPSENVDLRSFSFLKDQIAQLDAKPKEEFIQVFQPRLQVINRQLFSSYEKRNITPEQYQFLFNELSRLQYKYEDLTRPIR